MTETLRCKDCDYEVTRETFDKADRVLKRHHKKEHQVGN